MKTFELSIIDNITEENDEIIKKYWKLEDGKFQFPSGQLKDELGMKQYELSLLISNSSHCTVIIGGCQDCGDEICERVYSQTGFKSAIKRTAYRYDHCDKIYRAQVQKEWEDSRINEHNKMVELLADKKNKDQWKKLNPEELYVFKQILHFKERNKIFSHVFSGSYNETWKVVNKLEKLALVHVKREGNRVIDFLFSEDFEFLLHEADDHLGKVDSVDDTESYDVVNAYTFNIPVNINLSSERSPKYSKGFKLPTDVCFEKGVDYVVGAWILTDGSINISFRPRKTIVRSQDRELTLEEMENWVEYPFHNQEQSSDHMPDDPDDNPFPFYEQVFEKL